MEFQGEFEFELIQPHMAQKLMLRIEVGARALRVRSVSREEAWASAGVQDAWNTACETPGVLATWATAAAMLPLPLALKPFSA